MLIAYVISVVIFKNNIFKKCVVGNIFRKVKNLFSTANFRLRKFFFKLSTSVFFFFNAYFNYLQN